MLVRLSKLMLHLVLDVLQSISIYTCERANERLQTQHTTYCDLCNGQMIRSPIGWTEDVNHRYVTRLMGVAVSLSLTCRCLYCSGGRSKWLYGAGVRSALAQSSIAAIYVYAVLYMCCVLRDGRTV